MLSKSHRFHGRNSLNYVYKSGKTFRGQYFALKVVQNPRRSSYRCAVVVSKKVNKSAVARNNTRRRIFEIIRQNEAYITKPYDIVITVFQPNLGKLPSGEISTSVTDLLREAQIISPSPKSAANARDIIDEKEN